MKSNEFDRACQDVEKALNESGVNNTTSHPFWRIYNSKSEIESALNMRSKIQHYLTLFPDNKLLQELASLK